ncbi:MAG: hypothetical protein CME63_00210 [Halobacteriovoraceae bacterium]|nr:hypothetical protein [Halobacteriovoraceae bacterium]|tara:strand:+ start:19603 stop:20466 length:864 start_codon:yes stop_codon:yes gene_type:complete
MSTETSKKKLLENPIANGIVVPIAIVLVGAIVVFGVTKLLSAERSYKDLVREMHTKTFGNRWVAAFELSKLISSSQIPEEDIPWLLENLEEIYNKAQDPRTRQFSVVAAGALQNENSVSLLEKAVEDSDTKVRFHAVVSVGNMSQGTSFSKWGKILELLKQKEDIGMTQAASLALATHRVPQAEPELVKLLTHENAVLRYTVASGLVNYKNEQAIPVLRELLELSPGKAGEGSLNEDQVVALKLSLLNSIKINEWKILEEEIQQVANSDKSLKVVESAKDLLKSLKN